MYTSRRDRASSVFRAGDSPLGRRGLAEPVGWEAREDPEVPQDNDDDDGDEARERATSPSVGLER